jgi:hypothetical protein
MNLERHRARKRAYRSWIDRNDDHRGAVVVPPSADSRNRWPLALSVVPEMVARRKIVPAVPNSDDPGRGMRVGIEGGLAFPWDLATSVRAQAARWASPTLTDVEVRAPRPEISHRFLTTLSVKGDPDDL